MSADDPPRGATAPEGAEPEANHLTDYPPRRDLAWALPGPGAPPTERLVRSGAVPSLGYADRDR